MHDNEHLVMYVYVLFINDNDNDGGGRRSLDGMGDDERRDTADYRRHS